MKLASFRTPDAQSWGIVEDDGIVDVGAQLRKWYPDLRSAIAAQAYSEARNLTPQSSRHAWNRVTWLPPIPKPAKILCVGLNYETHRQETRPAKALYPTIFTRFADTQIGHDAKILRPSDSRDLDYESELAVIIGRAGRYIRAEAAMEHVAGYACYNDATLRAWQRHTHQFTPGKNFPGTGAFGPALVTA